nr:unnamed protein product [Callosobruchus chinensis]
MDSGHLKNFTRMTAEDFERLIILVGPKISKNGYKISKSYTCAGSFSYYIALFSHIGLLYQLAIFI